LDPPSNLPCFAPDLVLFRCFCLLGQHLLLHRNCDVILLRSIISEEIALQEGLCLMEPLELVVTEEQLHL